MIEIKTTTPEEYRAAAVVVSTALMHGPDTDEDWDKKVPSWDGSDSLSAWDGDQCVGHAAGYRFETVIPGGARLATNGVTRVGVLPTHRRQGILRDLMQRLLTEGRERGQVLASLRASEGVIYSRFGFGVAGRCAEISVIPGSATPFRGAARDGSIRIAPRADLLSVIPPIYDRVATRPGIIARPEWMWARFLEEPMELGKSEFVVVHTNPDGVDDGFAHYKVDWKTEPFSPPQGTGEIYDLCGADAGVELALWDYLCHIDLVREWYAEERPEDEIAQIAAADPRAYRSKWRWDEQWMRLLDVDAALVARTYADGEPVAIGITDALFPANDGVWEISTSGAKRVDATTAELTCDVRAASTAYLGGVSWLSLAAIGDVTGSPDAITRADRLFAVPWAPYCGSGF